MKHFGIRKALSGFLAGAIMLGSIPFSAAAEEEFNITISVEGNTLGQGMYIEPVTYTLDEINSLIATEGYEPCTEETLTAGLVTLAMLIDNELEYEMTGTWDSTAYVAAIKGLDKGTLDIPSIITENGGPSNEENDGNDDEYLGEFDYNSMSGWMLCVDNHFIQVSCASYNAAEAEAEGATFESGSVIRWQFTLYGYGADLGTPFMMGVAYFDAANKDALYKKYAELSAKGFFDTNAQAKEDALAVMEDLTATQEEVDSALKALNDAASAEPVVPTTDRDISKELSSVLEQLAVSYPSPEFGTTNGEWTVLNLSRGGYYQPDNKYFSDYYDKIVETVNSKAEEVGMSGALDANTSTNNSRLIMALSSIGRDAHKVGKYDLIEAYNANGLDWIKKQGINGPVFALIALDTRGYETTDKTLRKQCVDYILEKQLADGGWAYFGTTADPDMTSMALQALAPYTSDENVKAACDKAFTVLSNTQQDDGGYTSWGSANSECVAQTIVACAAHGINPHTDARFVKNGKSLVDALMAFYNEDTKNFCHTIGDGGNAMATDQAVLGLVAYDRLKSEKTSLYNMTDVPAHEEELVLSVPANVTVEAGNKKVIISWGAVENATEYIVQRLENDIWSTVGISEGCSFTDTELTNGTVYSYKVIAVNGDVQSEASEIVNAVPEAPIPEAPTNVKATAGDKQVTVTWNAVDGATQYRVQRLNGSTWSTVGSPKTNSFTNTGLTNGTSYSYRVLALVDGKWSGVSAVVTAAPKGSIIPQNVKATAGDKQITVTWNTVDGASQYRVQRLNSSTWSTVGSPKTNSFTNTGLTNGTSYSYRVLALVDGKWSGASAVVTAAPKGGVIPQNVKATAGDKQIKLTWTAVSGATQYRVQRLNGSTWSTVGNPKTNSFTNTGLTNGTSYSYRVLALVDGKWSGASAVVTAAPKGSVIPQNVKATAGDKQVKLTWNAVDGASQYRVQRLNGSTWSTVGSPKTNSFTNTGLINGTSYSYRVLALVDGKWSGASAVVTAAPKGSIIPQNVKATAGDKQIKLTWTAVSGATQYRVQRLNSSTWSTVGSPKTNSFTNTGLTNGTSYSYRVLALVDGKWSGASAVVTAKPSK